MNTNAWEWDHVLVVAE